MKVDSDSEAVSPNYWGLFYHDCKDDLKKPLNLIYVFNYADSNFRPKNGPVKMPVFASNMRSSVD